jgi:FOG: GAF domain
MLIPALHPNETARLATLRDLNILDTPTEERFDRITRVTADLFQVPVALISLVDANRQWFKSCVGVNVRETPREISFCAHAILGDEIFYIPDTLSDPRFADNPLVTGEPHIRFYAGCPIAGPNALNLGTLCIVDYRPRTLDDHQMQLLRDLGKWAHVELAAIQILQQEISRQVEKLQHAEKTFFEFLESLPVGVLVLKADGKPYYSNQTAQQILGKEIAGEKPGDLPEVYHVCIAGTDREYPYERLPIVRALSGFSSTADDLEIHKPNEILQVQSWSTPIFHKGAVAYAISAFQDITDRKRAEHRLNAQYEITRVLSEAESLAEATPKIIQAICGSVGCEVGAIWEVESASNHLKCLDVWHRPTVDVTAFENLTRKFSMPPGVGLPGRVWTSKEPVWIPNIVEDANFPRTPAALTSGLHAAFAFPILSGNEVTAVMEFFSRRILKPDNDLLAMMTSMGSQIGQFIARKKAEAALKQSENSV